MALGVSISGNTDKFYHGHTIYLYQVEDCLYNSKKLIDSTTVNISGTFYFNTSVSETSQLIVNCNFVNFRFHALPGKNYQLILNAPENPNLVSIANNTEVGIVFKTLDEKDINYQISDFNYRLDSIQDILLDNFSYASFRKGIKQLLPKHRNTFLEHYQYDAIANQCLNLQAKDKAFFNEFISGNRYNPKNQESMVLLSGFYENSFKELSKFSTKAKEIVFEGNIHNFIELYNSWDFTPNRQLLEFAVVQSLYELHSSDIYPRKKVNRMFRDLKSLLVTDLGKSVYMGAKNMLRLYYSDEKFPDKLHPESTDMFNLVAFYTNQSAISKREILIAKDIVDQLPFNVNFVVYCVDCTSKDKVDGLASYRHLNRDPRTYEKYGLYNLPKFSLVNKDGIYLKEWLDMPSNRFEKELIAMANKIRKKN